MTRLRAARRSSAAIAVRLRQPRELVEAVLAVEKGYGAAVRRGTHHAGRGRPRLIDEEGLATLEQIVTRQPDISDAALTRIFCEKTRSDVSRATVAAAVARLGYFHVRGELTRRRRP